MWINLGDILDKIEHTPQKLKKLRQLRLSVRFCPNVRSFYARSFAIYGLSEDCEIRLGKIYSDNQRTINVVPIKHPNKWITAFAGWVEVWVDDEVRLKLAPLVLSGDFKETK